MGRAHPAKCGEWIDKIPGLTAERLQVQLEYGEHTDAVKKADKGPINYLYGCLKGSPLIKPAGYQTLEDKYLKVMQERVIEAREIEMLKEQLFDAEFKAWCLDNTDLVYEITSPAVQAYLKIQYRKRAS